MHENKNQMQMLKGVRSAVLLSRMMGKCSVKVGCKASGSRETGNENFMVTINPPFVFAVLTLHSHVLRCDYFSQYLDCLQFYNRGPSRAAVIITCILELTGQKNRWEFASPWLADGS